MTAVGPILVYSDGAEAITAALAARFPDERLRAVTTPEGLDAALAEGPEIAFTIGSRALPRPTHGRIVAHPTIRWFHVGGSGTEHVDGRWDPARTTVTNSVGVLAPFLAETCIGAILALNHGLLAYRAQQARREWREIPFRPLMGQRLLVVGAGAIGGELSRRAAAMGMEVVAIRRSDAPVPGAVEVLPPEALAASLSEADVVSLHLRLTPETRGLFDAAMFARMKPGALFLNSARGGHVVEADLAAALRSGHLAGAWLDVFETEPLSAESPLWDLPTLLVTPHTADGVVDWQERFTALFADNLTAWRAGRPLTNLVAPKT